MSRHHVLRRSAALFGAAVFAVAAVFASTAAPAWARAPRQRTGSNADTTSAADQSRTIVATGTSRVRGTPDVLTVQLGATSRGHTVGEALDRNNAAVRKVINVLLDGGVDKKDIQTNNLSVGPIYGDNGNDIQGYQVSNVVVAQLRDLDQAGSLLDKTVQAGGDDVVLRGVSFDVDDTSDLVATARVDAVKRARNQAEQLAAAAGVQLGDVLTISESSRDVGPALDVPATTGESTAAARMVIENGSEELTVQVSVVFSIR